MTTAADWTRVRQLFHEALDVAPEAREAFVKDRAEDPHVIKEVLSLLEAYPAAAGFLSAPADYAQVKSVVARLHPGNTLGPFRITGLIGAGGMGEVYRAWDTRLEREVAIKVLPEFSAEGVGPEQFEAEARAISRLTHPRISTLYDVGAAPVDGAEVRYLVMELVEGETLARRLERDPLPVDQALAIAIDIAEALAAAHTAGVIHRDVKPANIMLTRSGAKLLDFGLARLRPPVVVGPSSSVADVDPQTRTTGLIGTLPYMAPEVIRGAGSDARSDLFAFGAVLYEMLTGRQAFGGTSEGDVVASILEHDPPPIAVRQPLTPPALLRLIGTCLAKDPDDRWQTSLDLLRALRWIRDDISNPVPDPLRRGRFRYTLPLSAVAAIVLVMIAALYGGRRTPSAPQVSFLVFPPDGARFPRGTAEMAVSPDGKALVFVALGADGTRHLWMRRFDAVDSRRLEGTANAHFPFWSPDGRWIAFFSLTQLLKVPATGGQPQALCDVRVVGLNGGTWNAAGTILFSTFAHPLQRIPDSGGSPRAVSALDESRHELAQAYPVFLPDGRHFVYLSLTQGGDGPSVFQGSLDTRETHRLFTTDADVGVGGQYLVSRNRGLLLAQSFDPLRAEVTGAPFTLAEHIASDSPRRSGGAFSVAAAALAYRSASPDSHLIWFDRTGKSISAFHGEGDFHHPRLSPDERSVVIEKSDPSTGRHTVWMLDLARGTASRLLFDRAGAHVPVWSPDGRRIVFCSNRLGGCSLYSMGADGTGEPDLLLASTESKDYVATDWSLDGKFLLVRTAADGATGLSILPLEANQKPFADFDSSAIEMQGQFSPDVKWVSYTSNESGRPEVYVRPFPGSGAKRQVSTDGGVQGRWRRDGKEFFYLGLDGRMMAVDIRTSPSSFDAGTPRALFNTGITGSFVDRNNHYEVTRDGQRFLVNRSIEDENSAPITVVLNWQNARRQ